MLGRVVAIDEPRSRCGALGEKLQEVDRCAVGIVEVLEHDEAGRPSRRVFEKAGEFPIARQRRQRRRCDLGAVERRCDAGSAAAVVEVFEGVQPRFEGAGAELGHPARGPTADAVASAAARRCSTKVVLPMPTVPTTRTTPPAGCALGLGQRREESTVRALAQ